MMIHTATFSMAYLEDTWGADRDDWGLLGPLEHGKDDELRFALGELGWMLERRSDQHGVWYEALQSPFTADDIPESVYPGQPLK